ncbi:ATP-dependent DNA ligase [Streptomyces sp. NPDC056948]|uniref:ATP-dependent DNA ligase n=1 Tax=Streptomyces sp. NPDC056948 TaxID=3345975 RepID=UPI003643209A
MPTTTADVRPPLHRTRTPLPPRAATTVRFKTQGIQDSANSRASVWDILLHPEHGDVRTLQYDERRALLLDLLQDYDVQPPIQAVPMTDDPDVALTWYQQLQEQGLEGIVCKPATSAYKAGRIWRKVRHAETVDAEVVGYTGPAARPRALAVRLPGGRIALSQALKTPLAAQVSAHLVAGQPSRRARTNAGDTYRTTAHGPVVEVLAGTSPRHAVVTVTRLRSW